MGVHWAIGAAKNHIGKVEIIDLRTINPIDEKLIFEKVNVHGKCLIITEEPLNNSFAQALGGRIQEKCFRNLDAPVGTIGAENLPAIPLNSTLEATMLPNEEKVSDKINEILGF
jgi:2-oxoisovalerate dehydrogenase E1 component